MTRTLPALGLGLLLAAAGCREFDTPRTLRGTPRPDNPKLPVEEQERRARARYPLPSDDFRIGPPTFADAPDPVFGGSSSRGVR